MMEASHIHDFSLQDIIKPGKTTPWCAQIPPRCKNSTLGLLSRWSVSVCRREVPFVVCFSLHLLLRRGLLRNQEDEANLFGSRQLCQVPRDAHVSSGLCSWHWVTEQPRRVLSLA
jgi:hypothetical protein